MFALGQAVEGVGALSVDDGRGAPWLNDLHGAAIYPGTFGLLLAIFGTLSSLLTAVASHHHLLESRWTLAAVIVPVIAVALFVGGALVFGY